MAKRNFIAGWLLPNGEFLENTGDHPSTVAEYASEKTGVDFFQLTDKVSPFDVSPEEKQRLISAGFPAEVLDDAYEWATQHGWTMFRNNGGTLEVNAAGKWGDPRYLRKVKEYLYGIHFPTDERFTYDGEDVTLDTIDDIIASRRLGESVVDILLEDDLDPAELVRSTPQLVSEPYGTAY